MATDYATIVVRRGNADAWENSQRPLASGEWGYDETSRQMKMGDGFSLWPELPAAVTATGSGQLPSAVREAMAAEIKDPSSTEGAALRSISTVVNVRDFGAKGDGAADDTNAIQAAITAAGASTVSATVFLPSGSYVVRSIEMVKGVSIQGAGRDKTTIYAKSGDSSAALITFPAGYTDHVFLSDFTLWGGGSNNPNQRAILAYARSADGGPGSAGWGNGGMARVLIRNFQGDALWLRGGGGGTRELWQHQFLVFSHVDFIADRESAGGASARVTGKAGQLTWINCQFSTSAGTSESAGTNLVLAQERDEQGAFLSTSNSYAHTFLNCSVEGRARGVTIEGAFSIAFVGTFMEALGNAVRASSDARGITMIGTHFASAGHNAAANGALVEGSGTSVVSIFGGTVVGLVDRTWVDAVVAKGVTIDPTSQSASNTGQFAVNDGEITTRQYSTTIVNSPATLSKITSSLGVGEVLFVKAFGGALTLSDSGNIGLGGRPGPVVLPQNAIASFVRYDLTGDWQLASTSA